MRILIIVLLSCLTVSMYAQFELPKELIEKADDADYMMLSGAGGIWGFVHKDSIDFTILNTPAPNGYFASWDSINQRFEWVQVIAMDQDTFVFSEDFLGMATPGDPLRLNPDSLKNGIFDPVNEGDTIAISTAYIPNNSALSLLTTDASVFEPTYVLGTNTMTLITGPSEASVIPFSRAGIFANSTSFTLGSFSKSPQNTHERGFIFSLSSVYDRYADNSGTLRGLMYDVDDFTTLSLLDTFAFPTVSMLRDTADLLRSLIAAGGDGNGLLTVANDGQNVAVSRLVGFPDFEIDGVMKIEATNFPSHGGTGFSFTGEGGGVLSLSTDDDDFATPNPPEDGNRLGRLSFNGYVGGVPAYAAGGWIQVNTSDDWNGANRGAQMDFALTEDGSSGSPGNVVTMTRETGFTYKTFGELPDGSGGDYSQLQANSLIPLALLSDTAAILRTDLAPDGNGIFDAGGPVSGSRTLEFPTGTDIFRTEFPFFDGSTTAAQHDFTGLTVEYFGGSQTQPRLRIGKANGTEATPTNILLGDAFGNIEFAGFANGSLNAGVIAEAEALENFTSSSNTESIFRIKAAATGVTGPRNNTFGLIVDGGDGVGIETNASGTTRYLFPITQPTFAESVIGFDTNGDPTWLDFSSAGTWLDPQLSAGDLTVSYATRQFELILEALTNSNSNDIRAQTSNSVIFGNSNLVAGDQMFIAASDASIVGFDRTFTFPQTSSSKSSVISTSGGILVEDTDYSTIMSGLSTYLIDSDYSTAISARNGRADGVTRVIMYGDSPRAYNDGQIVTGSGTDGFTEGDQFDNIGAAQKSYYMDEIEFEFTSGTQQLIDVTTITLDTMAKAYRMEITATVYAVNGGDQSITTGEGSTYSYLYNVASDGTTATEGLFNQQISSATNGTIFIGCLTPGRCIDLDITGNDVTIQVDIGDQIGSNLDPTKVRVVMEVELFGIGSPF